MASPSGLAADAISVKTHPDARHPPAPQTPALQSNAPASDPAIERELLALMARSTPALLMMSALAAIGLGFVMHWTGARWAFLWIAVALVVVALRWIVLRRSPPAQLLTATPDECRSWRRRFEYGLHATSACWVVLAMLGAAVDPPGHYLLVVTMSALAAGASGILAPMLGAGRLYISAMLFPGALLLFGSMQIDFVMSALGIVFLVVMVNTHARNHRLLVQGIGLKLENAAIVSRLQELNHDLETQVQKRTTKLTIAAIADQVTGLPNRRYFLHWLEHHLASDPAQSPLTLLFLDLDHFKQINDALGHASGDRALIEVARRLAGALPQGAVCARWGGDEFVVAIKHCEGPDEASPTLADAMVAALAQPFLIDGKPVSLGVSIGSACYPHDARTDSALIVAADLAVAEAKRHGRGRVIRYEPSFSHVQARRFDLCRALPLAIERGELSLHYQPIFECESGRLHGYEALMRWHHPQLGWIDPEEFIAIAEESDTILDLGNWALREACAKARELAEPDFAPRMAVNVSVRQLLEPEFALQVARTLNQTGMPAQLLELEVTESLFTTDRLEASRPAIESLKALGVSLSIDDFGTGYSSLSRLLSVPVSTVKIDRSFIAELDTSGAMVVESTILLARKMGIAVLAEGVETKRQADQLSRMGIDLVQGYLFGRPAAMIAELAREDRMVGARAR